MTARDACLPTVGIDRGVEVFASLWGPDVRRLVEPLNAFCEIRDELAKLQRQLTRKVKRSSNWRKLKTNISRLRVHGERAPAPPAQALYRDRQEPRRREVEKLKVKNMSASAKGTTDEPGRNVAAKSGLNRSILDQGWSMFANMLGYKLAERGGALRFVNPAYTSQTCPECGVVDTASRRRQSEFVCTACGHADNADVVGARNISQARILAVEPPKRIRIPVGRRKPVEINHDA
jgi:putative transposase